MSLLQPELHQDKLEWDTAWNDLFPFTYTTQEMHNKTFSNILLRHVRRNLICRYCSGCMRISHINRFFIKKQLLYKTR